MRFRMTTTTEDVSLNAFMEEIADRVAEAVKEDAQITVDIRNRLEDSRAFSAHLQTENEEIRIVSVHEEGAPAERTKEAVA